MADLTQEELDERIAVLRRFRALLEQQRNKFREYLSVLESQQSKIEIDDGESLMAHAELETQIVANISNLQKVIVPLQKMYESSGEPEKNGVEQIQSELADLQSKVLAQNEKNRALLKAHMAQIREQLSTMAAMNPYRGRRSIYAPKEAVGAMVAVEA